MADKQVKPKRLPFANWASLSQFTVFMLNASLNFVVFWAFTAPKPVPAPIDPAAVVPATFWQQWWWLVDIGLAILTQIILLYVPMFIDTKSELYGKWRNKLQWVDTGLNYIAFTILFTMVVGIAPALKEFLSSIWGLFDQLFIAFGKAINVEVVLTLGIIWVLSDGVRQLGLITALVPRVGKAQGGGNQGGGNQRGGGGNQGGGNRDGNRDGGNKD